jgi:hypothetical protein
MNHKLLTFELSASGDHMEIHGDIAGLRELSRTLERIIETRQHEHLMTPSWGGSELTEEVQGEGARLLNKVTIHVW